MKKLFFTMLVAVAATFGFTSCGPVADIEFGDVAGATFEGKDSAKSLYTIIFGQANFTFTITDDGSTLPDAEYTGTFSVAENKVMLVYSSGTTVEYMTGDGAKKLLYATVTINGNDETITLTKK